MGRLAGMSTSWQQEQPDNAAEIARLKRGIVFRERLRDFELDFHSTCELFSPRRVDDGSRLLVEHFDVESDDVTLDLGCGYGAIGLAVARQTPRGRVHMVDRDYLAVELARRNAEANGLGNCRVYLSNGFSEVPGDVRFDNVLSNLPAKVGREMLSILLHDARARLVPGGRLGVVTIAGLRQWVKRNFKEAFGNYKKLKEGKGYVAAVACKSASDASTATD